MIVQLQDTMGTISEGLAKAALVGTIFTALLQCFFGFRLIKFWVAFAGFVIGFYLGFRYLAALIFPQETAWGKPLLVALALGAGLAIFSYKLFKVGLFLFCGSLAWYAAATFLVRLLAGRGSLAAQIGTYLLQAGAFLLAGYLAVRFFRTAVILITAIGGAWTAVHTLAELLPQLFPEQTTLLAACAAVAGAGILVQFVTTRK